jgi:HK97 family phage portal protein
VLKHQANEYMTPYSAFKAQASQAFWYGTGFLYIHFGASGNVEELIPLPSEGHERKIDPNSGQVWYIFRVTGDDGKTIERKFQPSELWIKHFETYDGIHGVGMLDMAKDAMETDLMAQKFAKKFYTNGARPSGIVTVEAELEEESKDIVRRDFEKMAGGMDNAFRTAVLDMGMKYTPLGISQRDSQFIESREFSVDEIARFTGIPQYMLQAGKQTYESNEQQRLDFVITTLVPHIIRDEQEGTMKLLRREDVEKGIFLRRNEMGLLRGDDKSRMEYYRGMWEVGVLRGDDIRAKEDRSPLPGGSGEHFFVSKNYDTIERIISGGGENDGNQT